MAVDLSLSGKVAVVSGGSRRTGAVPVRKALALAFLILFCSTVLHAKQQAVVRCTAGSPRWEGKAAKFKVVMGSSASPGECRLSVSLGNQELFATQAKIIDVLAIGLDLNLDGRPDLAFQTGPAGECCWTLHLLSLEKPPKLVGELANRFPFFLREQSGYGVPEFWTQDGAFGGGFDGLTVEELADLPNLAIQWAGANAFDVSSLSRYWRNHDQATAKLDSQLTPERIAAFRQSDGKLESSGPDLQPLRKTKAQALAIILTYLFAGYDGSAWAKLEELWPVSDAPRIRRLLADALATGLRSRLAQPPVFTNRNCQAPTVEPVFKAGGKVTPPRITYQPDPEYSEQARAEKLQGTLLLDALISADGCVRELRLVRRLGLGLDEKAIKAVLGWKFDPAKQDGKLVAVRVNIEVSFRLN
jgi:TonB family protein